MESRDSKLIADGRAWRVDGRAQALVGPGLATPLITANYVLFAFIFICIFKLGSCWQQASWFLEITFM